MASTVPLVREYAFVIPRLKLGIEQDSLTSIAIFCRYGSTKDVFPIGGLVDIGETAIAAGSRYCRQLVNFVIKPEQLCLFKVLDAVLDLNPVRINMYILDFKGGSFPTVYRTKDGASLLAKTVEALGNKALDDVDDDVFPPSLISTTLWGKPDEAFIYDWYGSFEKALCFDFGVFSTVADIEFNLNDDARTTPHLLKEFTMRRSTFFDIIWSEVTKVLRIRIFAFELKQNWEVGSASAEVHHASTVVLTLPPCHGETDSILDDHWAESKILITNAGIDANSRAAVRIMVGSFAGKLGQWASDNAVLINELNTLPALGAFTEVSYVVNEDLSASEYISLHSLIGLDQQSESLLKYTQAFNHSYDYLKNDISLKAAVILYIRGIKSVSLSTILWSNWKNGKYTTLIALQTDAFEIL